jgi:CheY-like chemotaxis protein
MPSTVLLVDDDPAVRQFIDDALTDGGYRIITAGMAEEALRVLLAGTAVDLLVTDVLMPGLDGFALACKAKRLRPSLRVLHISGHADPARLQGERAHGRLLRKPFRVSELLAAVKEALGAPCPGK